MAYNLQPLITILEGILDPHQPRWIVDENNPQLHSLLDKATSLQKLLDSKSSLTKIDSSLESQIREAAHQAEDILESHMVDQVLSGSNCVRFTLSTPGLQQVAQDLDSVMEQAEKLMETEDKKLDSTVDKVLKPMEMEDKKKLPELDSSMEQVKLVEMEDNTMQSSSSSSSKSVVVGIDEDLMQLKDRLTGMQKKLEIVPIVGMGGVGKTTLARKLYEDLLIVDNFAYRSWATISQDYNMPQILKSLLSCIIGQECDEHSDDLKDMLYRRLYGRKYLIVLDDIWSTKFWDEIRMYFPNNNNGSRIVITTRESDVANYADSLSSHHRVQLLSRLESWNLLHRLVFGEENCAPELDEIGQKIASDCSGLPLAISVIGGMLSKMERTKDVWEKIGDNVITAISRSDEQCSSILSLSYNHLPNHLKPCFLYMGAFPEDFEISGSTLVQLWVAEGFVKSNGERSLEEEAEDWLKYLIERNLFLVRKYKKNGKPKSYSMHDMLRDLCILKCAEDKLFYVTSGPNVTFSNTRRIRFDSSNGKVNANALIESMSLTRSFIWIHNRRNQLPFGVFSVSRLLRVLYLINVKFTEFPTEIFEFVNLRFLVVGLVVTLISRYFTHSRVKIPRGISRLRNLQTLIAPRCEFDVPSELLQLSELRNVNVFGFELLKDEEMNYSVMKKLQMISVVGVAEEATNLDAFLKSIPNIKKLAINGRHRMKSTTSDFSHLHKLEILRCKGFTIDSPDSSDCRSKVIFPRNIRKLVLDGCVTNSGVLRTLCALHKLEVLKIAGCKFKSEEEIREDEWELADGDVFCSLQILSLRSLDVVRWIADETNFPRLRHLYILFCRKLKEIPSSIGEIPTLQLIDLHDCTESLVASAKRIMEEEYENGNYDLKLSIH
ncbi:putative late blight resistance protein homolog R1B-16 [Salvia hispanica]|uniref:putative late blight resistance protein homolog R1B-16 n=1 Tax=Salvia hispanica TaxID=49212 RepID=UPI0020094698|nr:putative late blight resistance protein homolog R1B-16 [Salvia hispanica]